MCETWLFYVRDKTLLYVSSSFVWCDSFICTEEQVCATRRIHTCDFVYVWKLIFVRHDFFMCHVTHMNESCHTYEWVTSHIWVSRLSCLHIYTYAHTHTRTHTHTLSLSLSLSHTHTHTHTHVRGRTEGGDEKCIYHNLTTCLPGMGWLRLVGSLKLQVSFAKEPYKTDDIVQKRPLILRSLLIVATPYSCVSIGLFRVYTKCI